jgi:hypothetical protein
VLLENIVGNRKEIEQPFKIKLGGVECLVRYVGRNVKDGLVWYLRRREKVAGRYVE